MQHLRTQCHGAQARAPGTTPPPEAASKAQRRLRKMQMERDKAAEKLAKAERNLLAAEAEARGAIFLMHWHRRAPHGDGLEGAGGGASAATSACSKEAQAYVTALQADLKRMEAVSKDALWYAARECPDGDGVHVLIATADAKTALKYGLQELPLGAAAHVVDLGRAGRMEVPVGVLRGVVEGGTELGKGGGSDAGARGGGVVGGGGAPAAMYASLPVAGSCDVESGTAKSERRAAKQQRILEQRSASLLGHLAEEDPGARALAESLMSGVIGTHTRGGGGAGGSADVAAAMAAASGTRVARSEGCSSDEESSDDDMLPAVAVAAVEAGACESVDDSSDEEEVKGGAPAAVGGGLAEANAAQAAAKAMMDGARKGDDIDSSSSSSSSSEEGCSSDEEAGTKIEGKATAAACV